MLIIKIVEEKTEKPKRKLFRKKSINELLPERINLKIDNTVFTVVRAPKKYFYSNEFLVFLKRFKGRVLPCGDNEIDAYIYPYIFDLNFYYKKAYLSNLLNVLKSQNGKNLSVLIEDENISITPELIEVAKLCRKIGIKTTKNIDDFINNCYRELGLKVNINNLNYEDYNIIFNLNNINNNMKKDIIFNNKISIINIDYRYFSVNEKVKRLLDLNVPLNYACAVVYSKTY